MFLFLSFGFFIDHFYINHINISCKNYNIFSSGFMIYVEIRYNNYNVENRAGPWPVWFLRFT